MKHLISTTIFLLLGSLLFAQTNPAPHDLFASDYLWLDMPDATTTVYPDGMQGLTGPAVTATQAEDLPVNHQATGDGALNPNSVANNSRTFRNEGLAISMLSAGETTSPLAIVWSVSTIGCEDISLTWGASANVTFVDGQRVSIGMQYRVGESGDWSNTASTDRYSSSTTGVILRFTFDFPAELENQPIVQFRWVYHFEAPPTLIGDRIDFDDLDVSALTRTTKAPPTANFGYTQTDSFSISFVDSSLDYPSSWVWDFGDSTFGYSQHPTHTYDSLGVYEVMLIASNGGGSDTSTHEVLVVEDFGEVEGVIAVDDEFSTDKDSAITFNVATNDLGDSLLLDSISIIESTQNGDVAVLAAGDIMYIPDSGYVGADSFSYELCDSVGSCDTASVFITVIGAQIVENKNKKELYTSVFPNPSNGEVSIIIDEGYEIKFLKLISIIGTDVEIKYNVISLHSAQLNTSELKNGNYMLQIYTDQGVISRNLIKY